MRKPARIITALTAALLFFSYSFSQTPVMKVDGKEEAGVYLKNLSVDIKVAGNIATTTMQLVFHNNYTRILEGELTIPLPEGANVSRYALDINGKMREAVPVDKAKGTQVFEAIERRRVDPGLLEKVEGNNFRTRVYPIPGNGERTIIIAYEQELRSEKNHSLRYYLPLNYKTAIPFFSLKAAVLQSASQPVVENNPADLRFNEWHNNYQASMEKTNFIPGASLSFTIPKSNDIAEVMMQPKNDGYYFLVNLFNNKTSRSKKSAESIAILWDVSLSSIHRDLLKEFELLEQYFNRNKNVSVTLIAFNSQARKINDYVVRNGNWDAIKKDIARFTYDGGTDFSAVVLPPADEYLLFTDGLNSFSNKTIGIPAKPVYTITSSPRADFSQLLWLAIKTGGAFLNLNSAKADELVKLISEQPLQFLGIKENDQVESVTPALPVAVMSNTSIAGFSKTSKGSITLQFGYGATVAFEKTVVMDASRHETSLLNIEKVWAQKRISELDIQYEKNKTTIEQLGKQYGIVTRNTSLIVLETAWDYAQYDIMPPAELQAEYDRIMKNRNIFTRDQQRTINNNAVVYFDQLKLWYGIPLARITTEKNKPEPVQQAPGQSIRDSVFVRRPGENPSNRDRDREETRSLDEVVVVGYGNQRRKSVTGSVTTISGESINSNSSIHNVLQGRVPGVQVTPSNSSPGYRNSNVIIRGTTSITGNSPQYIIDGRYATAREVELLNQNDIESIFIDRMGNYIPGGATQGYYYFNRQDPSLPKIKWKKIKYITGVDRASFKEISATVRETYINELEKSPEPKRYQKYLELRNDNMSSPAFYFNVASWFFENDDLETGLNILQNLTELDMQDHELYKMLGYKLKELGQYEMEVDAFRKVLEWRPMEPQSYRDYGLALQDAGYYQRALDTLCLALTKNYAVEVSGLYPGIEEMIVTEINQLIATHPGLVIPDLPGDIIAPMPMDLRIVVNWNMNDTDLDLWVTDPVGEKCYYGRRNTQLNGRMSNDFTRGYGPEQFLLKKAPKGKYKVEVNFYGESVAKLVGPTTIQAEIYTHYGTAQQKRQVVTMQMKKNRNDVVLVAEFEFK